jgi:hypothetical protein
LHKVIYKKIPYPSVIEHTGWPFWQQVFDVFLKIDANRPVFVVIAPGKHSNFIQL